MRKLNPNSDAWGGAFGSPSIWGGAWGWSWSRKGSSVAAGGHGGFRRPLIAVIEVDGTSYRVPIDRAQEFFDALKAKIKALPKKQQKPKLKRKMKKGRVVKELVEPIKIVIKSAPIEYFAQIEAIVDRTQEIFNTIWNRALQKYLLEQDDEEAILLLIH